MITGSLVATPSHAAATRAAKPAAPPAPARSGIVPQVLLNGVGPLDWNAAVSRDRGTVGGAPEWPALRVLGPQAESLYVFPEHAYAPALVAAWPRQDMAAHWVHIFPNYRWLMVETPVDSASAFTPAPEGTDPTGGPIPRHARFFDAKGKLLWEGRAGSIPAALGRDLVLTRRIARHDSIPRMSVLRVPGGSSRVSWPALAGWGVSSQLENFLAVNTIGLVDTVTGLRQDELRLLDLEGTILWSRILAADPREFAVSNFGDVAIAREQQLIVFDRSGTEKLRVTLPRNSVGRTAITPDGRYALVATSAPVGRHGAAGIWMALYDTSTKAPVWSRKNLPVEGGKFAEVLELSLSDDAQRVLVRLTTGPVFLLGNDGRRLASWNLERISRGEYDPGTVPRRTWLSGNGDLVAFTMPVAPSLPGARGWLFRVPR